MELNNSDSDHNSNGKRQQDKGPTEQQSKRHKTGILLLKHINLLLTTLVPSSIFSTTLFPTSLPLTPAPQRDWVFVDSNEDHNLTPTEVPPTIALPNEVQTTIALPNDDDVPDLEPVEEESDEEREEHQPSIKGSRRPRKQIQYRVGKSDFTNLCHINEMMNDLRPLVDNLNDWIHRRLNPTANDRYDLSTDFDRERLQEIYDAVSSVAVIGRFNHHTISGAPPNVHETTMED